MRTFLQGTHLQRLAEKKMKVQHHEQELSHLRHLYHQARKEVISLKGIGSTVVVEEVAE